MAAPQELEARLLQTEREKDSVRAQLHEVQLSMRTEGEFGNAGKRLRWAAALAGRLGWALAGWLQAGGLSWHCPGAGGAPVLVQARLRLACSC